MTQIVSVTESGLYSPTTQSTEHALRRQVSHSVQVTEFDLLNVACNSQSRSIYDIYVISKTFT